MAGLSPTVNAVFLRSNDKEEEEEEEEAYGRHCKDTLRSFSVIELGYTSGGFVGIPSRLTRAFIDLYRLLSRHFETLRLMVKTVEAVTDAENASIEEM
jgi:hypothetical protein